MLRFEAKKFKFYEWGTERNCMKTAGGKIGTVA